MKQVVIHEVDKIEGIDLTRYTNGTIFMTKRNAYMLHYGKLKQLLSNQTKGRVKKDDK